MMLVFVVPRVVIMALHKHVDHKDFAQYMLGRLSDRLTVEEVEAARKLVRFYAERMSYNYQNALFPMTLDSPCPDIANAWEIAEGRATAYPFGMSGSYQGVVYTPCAPTADVGRLKYANGS